MISPHVVRGLAGAVMIEQQRAFVEERGLRRIEVFRLGARLHRPPAEGDDAAGAVVDRKHHPVAEPVVGDGDVGPMDEQARLDHLLGADALGGERVAQRKALGERIPERKALLHRGRRGRGRRDSRALWRRSAAAGSPRTGAPPCAMTSMRLARFFSSAASASLKRGMARPAMPASRSTASGKLRPSVSIRKAKMSPCLPDEKSWKKPFWSLTKNDGVFSEVKGESAAHSRPALRNLTRAPTTSDTGSRARISSRKAGGNFMARQIGLGSGFGKKARALSPAFMRAWG